MMPTRWPSYILVILAAFLGWMIPYGLSRVGKWIGFSKKNPSSPDFPTVASNLTAPPISVRFHLAALLFPAFLSLTLLGVPLLFSVHSEEGGVSSFLVAAIAIPLMIVLFYCLRKGDLSWNAPRSREESMDEERGK